jgi:predicted DNA-binding transcriptional regulator YafY
MPASKNILLRYATIDECLQRKARHWTFEKLRQAVSDRINMQLGTSEGVSVRTLREDLKNMRPGGATGYNAPLDFTPEQGYHYSEPNYSIFNSPLTIEDLVILQEVLRTIKQLQGLGMAEEMEPLVQRLELRLSYQNELANKVILQFEQPSSYSGQQWLSQLYSAIKQELALTLVYQPFTAILERHEVVHPYLLKQYNGRWFVVGQRHNQQLGASVFALDRIKSIEAHEEVYQASFTDPATWFKKLIGMSILPAAQEVRVLLRFAPERLPYVLTKPLHISQQVQEAMNGPVVELQIIPTRELLTLLLSFGGDVEVLEPGDLRECLANELRRAAERYL